MVDAISIILILLIIGGGSTFLITGVNACMSMIEYGWDEGRGFLSVSLCGLAFCVLALATTLSYFPLFA